MKIKNKYLLKYVFGWSQSLDELPQGVTAAPKLWLFWFLRKDKKWKKQ